MMIPAGKPAVGRSLDKSSSAGRLQAAAARFRPTAGQPAVGRSLA
jgi:hypothetical protein